MTLARGIALGALVIGVAVLAVLVLGGGGSHEYRLRFLDAGQLVKGDDVQIGGRRVGGIQAIALTDDNQAEVTIALDDAYAPLREGTTATIRATSLSGYANRYIQLTPGPTNAKALRDGTTIGTDRTTAPVDLDAVFDTLDEKARRSLQQVIHGSAVQYAGKGRQANLANRYFNPALYSTSRLVNELDRDQRAFTDFIVQSSRVVTALAERRDTLTALVDNASETAQAIGSENAALGRSLDLLPGTLRRGNTTFVNLRSTLDDLDTLVAAAKPATRRLAPFLAELRPLVHAAQPTIGDLRRLIGRPGPNNDLIDLLRKAPALDQASRPAFADSIAALQKSQPVIEFIRPYTPDLIGWIRDFGQGAANYDANGHYARIQPMFGAFQLADNPAGLTLNAVPPSQRLKGMQTGFLRRCPGTATQPPADGSAPFTDGGKLDCDPTQVPPGK